MTNSKVVLPRRSLIALCGPAGSGKSTFAAEIIRHNRLPTTAHISSDACRVMLCDETTSLTEAQWALLQPNTFRLFLTIVDMRMSIGRPVLADGVNLHSELRTGLLELAQKHEYPSALVVFDMSIGTCLAQNQQRDEGRRIPAWQIRAQRHTLDDALPGMVEAGWDRVVVLNDQRRTVVIELTG